MLNVAGAGACHYDVAIFQNYDADFNPANLPTGFILGHENAGWVEEVGVGVSSKSR
ncbi:alcohol dehydrogenase catalytic domain-containing protein [Enteractinococcus helveticum]|uniref:alcohol dehydrogenase catalytic domain-containing protein n=1 Tax=Enteractinococcus helveticum TaxID=1837282 RepID=UPI0009EE94C7|nr:alcohol dehydrogenase catalytic domain-containing protein [Enteractinococcus helveticum]